MPSFNHPYRPPNSHQHRKTPSGRATSGCTRLKISALLTLTLTLSLAGLGVGCAEVTQAVAQAPQAPPPADVGSRPTLAPPAQSVIPTVNIAPAQGWPSGVQPLPMAGLQLTALARGLEHPRWVYVLPNGDVLVAESNKPEPAEKTEKTEGLVSTIRAWVMGRVMRQAGAGVASANRITLLRDADGDGVAETRSVFLQGLNSPFGMALVGQDFYVANTDAVLRFSYTPGQTSLTDPGRKVLDLPAGPINHHWTKNLIASPDGQRLYVTVGSNSNVGENSLAAEEGRAAIWELDLPSGAHRLYATGLRNPNGLGWEPATQKLWTVVNERDELGNDLVPDYLTSVVDGAFYGWPFSYFGTHLDPRVKPQRPDLVAKAVVPDYALGSHVAPLGMAFSTGVNLPQALAQGVFIGEHGSWNRQPRSGYKVVFVPFKNGRPEGLPVDVLTGFLSPEGKAYGRPVGVAMDARGGLLVADDVGNVVWRVSR